MSGQRHKVLLVDDDEDAFVIFRGLLDQPYLEPVDLDWVNTHEAGLAAMLRGEHNAYLVDYRLGARNGLELLREAIAAGCQAPILILTGTGQHELDLQALREGAADYLVKGECSGTAIQRSLRFAIERNRERTELRKSQAQLAMITDQMPAILWTTDCQLRFTSQLGMGLQGLRLRPDELVSMSLMEYLGTDPAALEICNHHRRALLGETVHYEARRMGRVLRAQVKPLRDDRGLIVGTVGTALDVTDTQEIEAEFNAARKIQQGMLPRDMPSLPGFEFAAACHPCDATGGDFFDFIPLPDGSLGLVVADVSRHGFASALVMASTRRLLRTLLEQGVPLTEALSITNQAVIQDTNAEYFVTLFFAALDPETGCVNFAGVGHKGYVVDPTEPAQLLASTSFPLGIDSQPIRLCRDPIQLEPGQILLLYTDGYEEAFSSTREMFGAQRILEIVQAHADRPAAEIVQALDDGVRDFCQNSAPVDDQTVVILKMNPQPAIRLSVDNRESPIEAKTEVVGLG